jgi:hypothetical protein
MITRRDEQQRGSVRADAIQAQRAWRPAGDERDDQLVQALELAGQELGSPPEVP